MNPQLQVKFAQGIRFTTRVYPDFPFHYIWGEYASTWKGAFGTEDPDEALRECRRMEGVKECHWAWDGALVYVSEFPALHFERGLEVLSTTFGFWCSDLPLFSLLRFADRLSLAERLEGYLLMRLKFWGTYLDPTPTRATFLGDGASLSTEESRELSDLI